MMRRKKNKGFTLIELVLVLAIIGTLLAIAGISGTAMLNKYRVESQTKQMYADLMNARVGALSKNRKYFVTPTATQYTIYEDTNPGPDGDGVLQAASDNRVMQVILNGTYAVTMTPAASVVNTINFDQRGLVSWSLGIVSVPTVTQQTIRVTNSYGAAYDCIDISPMKIRMGSWNGAGCNVQ
jgi:prepilin-type N-terminal cleavage/methylation domain-containing protein